MKSSALLALAASVAQVSAHGFVIGGDVNGTPFEGWPLDNFYKTPAPDSIGWATTATDSGFVAPDAFTTGDIICHRGATNGKLSLPVAAGDVVTLQWNTWPESHHGPVIDYMANCNGDCATVDKATLEWFKIDEKGIVDNSAAPGVWASDELMANDLSWPVTVPATLAPGNYVLRHEIIALHSAGQENGAQNYPQCLNLEVTGSGTESPAGVVGTELYTPADAGITVNIYTAGLEYEIPGPPLAFGAGAGAGTPAPAPAPGSSSSAAPVPTAAPVTPGNGTAPAVPTTMITAVRPSATAEPVETAPETPATPETPAEPETPAPVEEEEDDEC